MFRYRAPLAVPYTIKGLTMCLYHNESPVHALPCQQNIWIFRRPADIIMPDHCSIQCKCNIISPNNHAHANHHPRPPSPKPIHKTQV